MDGKLWNQVYRTVMSLDHPKPRRRPKFSDQIIVLIMLRAAADELSLNRVCDPTHWVGLPGVNPLPCQSTLSRRSRCPRIRALLNTAQDYLRCREATVQRLAAIDGRALVINPHSKDPDARWGYAIKGLAFGYKLHAIWDTGAVPLAWEIRPLNEAESVVAATTLVPRLPQAIGRRYLVGDCALDSNRLYGAAHHRGYQLLAPQKRPGKALGCRPHHPARIRGLALLKTRYGRKLYRRRTLIERQFGNGVMRPEGLRQLPGHVRRLHRVELFVHTKLLLNGFRILMNHNTLPSRRNPNA
jgi:hypothetical protein